MPDVSLTIHLIGAEHANHIKICETYVERIFSDIMSWVNRHALVALRVPAATGGL
jgi:hypothetical protein